MGTRDLDLHVKIIGWLHILSGALFVVIGFFAFVFFTGIGLAIGMEDPVAPPILTTIGFVAGMMMAVLALPSLAAGYGLLARKNWGRVLGIIVGVLELINFPLGTIIGVYTLWVLLQTEATDYFTPIKAATT